MELVSSTLYGINNRTGFDGTMILDTSETAGNPDLSALAEDVLFFIGEEQGRCHPQRAIELPRLALLSDLPALDCWRAVLDLSQLGFTRAYPVAPGRTLTHSASLTEAGYEQISRLRVPVPEGPVGELAMNSQPKHFAIDAVVAQELRFAGSSATRTQVRTVLRNTIEPKPDIAFATQVVEQLTGSHLTAVSGAEPCYQVSALGLFASSWGNNALAIIDGTLEYLRTKLSEDPTLDRFSWRALCRLRGFPRKQLTLAYLAITRTKLGLRMHDISGDYWWTVPPELDQVLDVPSALDHVRRAIESSRVEPPSIENQSATVRNNLADDTQRTAKRDDTIRAAESLKKMLSSRATGGSVDESEYRRLRRILLANEDAKPNIPEFVLTCSDVSEFWDFIRSRNSTYSERRAYIRDQFRPLLTILESESSWGGSSATTEVLVRLDWTEVQRIWRKAIDRKAHDPQGAITIARTLLESVCKHVLDEANEPYDSTTDLPKLYSLVAKRLKLAPSEHTEPIIKQILGGCHAVVSGLGALRSRIGDAHGTGKASARPEARHAELAVNLAGATATFIAQTWEKHRK